MSNNKTEVNDNLLRRKFNVIEYATPTVYDRHRFNPTFKLDLSYQVFHSYFEHSSEVVKYYESHKNENGKKTLSSYSGEVWSEQFIMDIDSEDLNEALQIARKILLLLDTNYEVDIRYVRPNFSGSKGFHIRIPAVLFGDFEPSDSLPSLHHKIAEVLSIGFGEVDLSIYKTIGLIRHVNSRNKKTGLYAIPLESSEVLTLAIDEIKELAKEQRELEYISTDELVAIEGLVALKEKQLDGISTSSGKGKPPSKSSSETPSSPRFYGVGKGDRTNKLLSNMGSYVSKGLTLEECIPLALAWNQNNTPPDSESYITSQVKSMYSRASAK